MIIFRYFQPFGFSPIVFVQVKECFILELHEVVKAPLVIACPRVFLFFYDRGRHAGLLTLKNDPFLVFLVFSGLFVSSGFWAGPGADHTVFDKNQETTFHSVQYFQFFWEIEGDRKECSNLRKMVNCKCFLSFGSFSSSF